MVPRLPLPTNALLLLSPCVALPRRLPARRPSFQTEHAVCAPAPAQSLPQFREMASADRETPPQQLHPPHSGHMATRRPSSSLREPVEDRESAAWKLLRNPTAATCANPGLSG